MNTDELVSVIVPVYNIEKYIEKCVGSLLNQTYEHLEIILINDGSKDQSGEICEQFQKKDKRVKVISKTNGGLSSARNAGIEKAQGEYYTFVDGDDYVHPQFIEKLLTGIKESGAEISACGLRIVNEKGENISELATGAKYQANNPFLDESLSATEVEKRYYRNKKDGFWYVIACNKMFKAQIFCNLRFAEGVLHEDEFIFHRLMRETREVRFIPDELYYYVQRNTGITSGKKDAERFHFLTEIYDQRMEQYLRANNEELQILCAEKYLRQTITSYCLLDKNQKKNAKEKYHSIIQSVNVRTRWKLAYPVLGMLSDAKHFL